MPELILFFHMELEPHELKEGLLNKEKKENNIQSTQREQ